MRGRYALPVVEGERLQPGQPEVYRWRLVAGNGRTLGQSIEHFPDEAAAVAGFWAIARMANSMTTTVVHTSLRRGWTWRIETTPGSVVIQSSRHYERHGSCQRAGRRMIDLLTVLAKR